MKCVTEPCNFYQSSYFLQTKKAETVGKDNEQFSGDLVATVKDMVNLTKAQRKVLGIADPTEEQAIKMIQERRHKFLSGVAKIFNKKMNH